MSGTRIPAGMTPAQAQQQYAAFRDRVLMAGQNYVLARAALEEARADLHIVEQIAKGEFEEDAPAEYEVGYYSIRPVESARQHCMGSRGPWSWAAS